MITRLPLPEQLTQIERFFLTAWVNFPPRSLGCNIFQNSTQQNNKADSPSVLISKLRLSRSQPTQTAVLTVGLELATETSAFGSNEALGRCVHAFKCFFFFLLSICSLAQSSLPLFPSPCQSVSSPHHLSPISSYFKTPSSHWFFSALPSLLFSCGIFFSPACESPFCSTVATQNGSAVWAETLGERLCQTERNKKRVGGGRRNHCKVAD